MILYVVQLVFNIDFRCEMKPCHWSVSFYEYGASTKSTQCMQQWQDMKLGLSSSAQPPKLRWSWHKFMFYVFSVKFETKISWLHSSVEANLKKKCWTSWMFVRFFCSFEEGMHASMCSHMCVKFQQVRIRGLTTYYYLGSDGKSGKCVAQKISGNKVKRCNIKI